MVTGRLKQIGLKIDVDTEKGTAIGVPALCKLLYKMQLPATFYLALGPDNTGRALRRIWRPGFLLKCLKTKVVSNYGFSTILNGLLWPGPHVGGKHECLLRKVAGMGFEVGIHCYDHQRWQNGVSASLSEMEIAQEFARATQEFERIFDRQALTAAAPGWQANDKSLRVYQAAGIEYASDCRGTAPFYPIYHGKRIPVLQLPTSLPTLDELLVDSNGKADQSSIDRLQELVTQQDFNLFTLHAELEGMGYLDWFERLLKSWLASGYQLVTVGQLARQYQDRAPSCVMLQRPVTNRAGVLAMQGDVEHIE